MKRSSIRRFLTILLACGAAAALPPGGLRKAAAKLPEFQTWDVIQIQGQRVGYVESSLRLAEESGRQVAKVRQLTKFSLQRFGQETRMEVDYRDTETPDGALTEFKLVMKQGVNPIRTVGKVAGNRLELQIESQGQKQEHSVAWPEGAGGLLGAELSLLAKPLKSGEKRTVEYLNMDNQTLTAEMTARDKESVELPGGRFRLLKIDLVERMAPNAQGQQVEIKAAAWANTAGDVLKSWLKPMNLETFRVTREVALAKTPLAKLDLGKATLVKLDRAIPDAHACKQVRYRVHLDDGDPVAAFPAGPSQEVRRIDEHTAKVTVRAIRPASGAESTTDRPTEADLAPNNFIQSDDPQIVARAKAAAGDETDPWKVAVALESYVNRDVTRKDYSQAWATASEVAQSREGNCKATCRLPGGPGPRGKSPPRWWPDWSACPRPRPSAATCGPNFILGDVGSVSMPCWPRGASAADISNWHTAPWPAPRPTTSSSP